MGMFGFSSFAGAISPTVAKAKTHSIWESIEVYPKEPLETWTVEKEKTATYQPYQAYQLPQLKSEFPLIPVAVGGVILMIMMMMFLRK